jgi:hypothetical protein
MLASRPTEVLPSPAPYSVVGSSSKRPAILPPARAQPPASFATNNNIIHPAKRRRTETPPNFTRILPPKPTYLPNPQPTCVLPRRIATPGALQGHTITKGEDRNAISHKGETQTKEVALQLAYPKNRLHSPEVNGAGLTRRPFAKETRIELSNQKTSIPKVMLLKLHMVLCLTIL